MFGVYRQPVNYRTPQLFRRQNFEAAQLRWLLNRGIEKYTTATVGTPYAANSFFDDANSVLGNVAVFARTFSPSAVEVFADGDGIPYPASPVVGRQSVTFREYQPASRTYVSVTGAMDGITATLYFNNQTPAAVGTIPDQQAYTNVAYEGPILDDYITDGENDPIVWTSVGNVLPTGVTVQTVTLNIGQPSQRTVQRLRGTPATGQQSTKAITLRGTDIVGAFVDRSFAMVTGIGQLVPDVDNGTTPLQTGLDLIAAAMPTSPFSLRYIDDVVAEGNIVNTFPAGGTYVAPGTPISLDVSGVVVPAFLGLDQTVVLPSLLARGFVVITVEASSGGYPAGAVFQLTESDVLLIAGDILPFGSTLRMYVVSGSAEGSGSFHLFDQFIADCSLRLHNLDTDPYRLGFITGAVSPLRAMAVPSWGTSGQTDLSASQCVPGGQYGDGGPYLVANEITETNGFVKWMVSDITIRPDPDNPSNVRYAILYNDLSKRCAGWIDLGDVTDFAIGYTFAFDPATGLIQWQVQ